MMIFFDIDQTLIDQRKAEAAAARELLAVYHDSLGRNYSVVSFCRIWDFLRDKHARAFFAGVITSQEQRRLRVRELFGRIGWELSDREADDCFALYERHYRRHWTLFDDVLPCLHGVIAAPDRHHFQRQRRAPKAQAGRNRHRGFLCGDRGVTGSGRR